MRRWRGEWIQEECRKRDRRDAAAKLTEGKDKNEGTRKVCV